MVGLRKTEFWLIGLFAAVQPAIMDRPVLLLCFSILWPFTAAKVLALKATVLLLLTMLIKAKIRITAFSALGLFLLLLQTLVFLAVSGGALYVTQQRRPKVT